MGNEKEALLPESTSIKAADREIKVWNDTHWRKVRAKDGVDDAFLCNSFTFNDFKSGGGKGGNLMAFTGDAKYIVKELNDGDHKSLLNVTASFVDHLLEDCTLLSPFYMHYQDVPSGRKFICMKNLLRRDKSYSGIYDLKGCNDDKALERDGKKVRSIHKRIWNVQMWCGKTFWSDERKYYYNEKKEAYKLKLKVTADEHTMIMQRLQSDTQWLASNNLMDYSLLVGVYRESQQEAISDPVVQKSLKGPRGKLNFPLVHKDGQDVVLFYVGIIDILQQWTFGKKCAMCIKSLEFNKATIPPRPYAERFYKHFGAAFKGSAQPFSLPVEAPVEAPPAVAPVAEAAQAFTSKGAGNAGCIAWKDESTEWPPREQLARILRDIRTGEAKPASELNEYRKKALKLVEAGHEPPANAQFYYMMNVDKSPSVDRAEFTAGMSKIPGFEDVMFTIQTAELFSNGDGSVDLEEWLALCHEYPQLEKHIAQHISEFGFPWRDLLVMQSHNAPPSSLVSPDPEYEKELVSNVVEIPEGAQRRIPLSAEAEGKIGEALEDLRSDRFNEQIAFTRKEEALNVEVEAKVEPPPETAGGFFCNCRCK